MFDRRTFAEMRRSGMGVGVSKSKLSQAMLETLLQLPPGTDGLKETIVARLGLLGQMAPTRDINTAWNDAKKKAAKEYPDKFVLDRRNVLHWNDGSVKVLDNRISAANIKKLNDLADAEKCSVDRVLSKLIRHYKRNA